MRYVTHKRALEDDAGRTGPFDKDDDVVLHRYRLSNDKPGEGWAVITVGSDGTFQAISDWGDYAYWWSSFGSQDVRSFLCGTNAHYVGGKLAGGQDEYDGEATYASIKRDLDEILADNVGKEGSSARNRRDFAESELRLLDEWESEIKYSSSGFDRWTQETSMDEPWCHHERRTPIQLQMFMERVFPRLQAIMKAELEAEARPLLLVVRILEDLPRRSAHGATTRPSHVGPDDVVRPDRPAVNDGHQQSNHDTDLYGRVGARRRIGSRSARRRCRA